MMAEHLPLTASPGHCGQKLESVGALAAAFEVDPPQVLQDQVGRVVPGRDHNLVILIHQDWPQGWAAGSQDCPVGPDNLAAGFFLSFLCYYWGGKL